MRRWGMVSGLMVAIMLVVGTLPVGAAAAFASPMFQQQWNAGEAAAPNFWGPLGTARDGQREPYKETQDGTRLVQYFDKARMELGSGVGATNGLLATEMIFGRVQVGDSGFESRPPPAIAMAGDLDNPGPTYAMLGTSGAALLAETPSTETQQANYSFSATGVIGTYRGPQYNDPYAVISHPESATKHNVPKIFCDFRAQVGLATIGYAISEPFWTSIKVGGQQRDVLVQAYQRRILTYTPTNPERYKIEFGNIGAHYYQWRYIGTGTSASALPAAAPKPAGVAFTAARGGPQGGTALVSVHTAPNATCGIGLTTPNGTNANAKGLVDKTADADGNVSWEWPLSTGLPGTWTIVVSCNGATADTPIPVSP